MSSTVRFMFSPNGLVSPPRSGRAAESIPALDSAPLRFEFMRAAVGDIHYGKTSQGALMPLFQRATFQYSMYYPLLRRLDPESIGVKMYEVPAAAPSIA